jgi:prophage tail gpP-like protein
MHDLALCARCNEAQLRNTSTDQSDTRAIWRALCKCTQKREAIRRFDKCICIVDDEDQLTVWRREIGKERRRTYGWRLLLANRSRETRQAHAIILIGGEMERVTQVTTCP